MSIFAAIYDFIQAVREALLDLIVLYRRSAWANVDRRPRRLEGRLVQPPGVHASVPSWSPIALSVGFFLALLGLIASLPLLALGLVVTLGGGWGWLRSANREWRHVETAVEHGAAA